MWRYWGNLRKMQVPTGGSVAERNSSAITDHLDYLQPGDPETKSRFGRRAKARERGELWIEVDMDFGKYGVKRRIALIDIGCDVFAVTQTGTYPEGSLQKARRPFALSAVGSQPVHARILGARVDVTLPV